MSEQKLIAQTAVEEIAAAFEDGFQIGDLATAARIAFVAAQQVSGLTGPARREYVLTIVDRAIDRINPWGPDAAYKAAAAAVLPGVIDWVVDAAKGRLGPIAGGDSQDAA